MRLLLLCLFLPLAALAQEQVNDTEAAGLALLGTEQEEGEELLYRVGPGDQIDIKVLGEEDLTVTVRVDGKGNIDYPVLGSIALGGKSTEEAADYIQGMLAVCCLKEPDVTVHVDEFSAHTVDVLGAVNKPGSVVLERPLRVLEVLSQAGGLKEEAASLATLLHAGGGQEQVDLYKLLEEGVIGENLLLVGGDVLFVPEADTVVVTGEVKQEGAVAWRDGLTLVQAVSEAGGLTEYARVRRVQVIR